MKQFWCWLFLLPIACLSGEVSFQEIAKIPAANWLSYSGDYSGRRFSQLKKIHADNVGNLVPAWVFHIPRSTRLQVTPLVAGGVMYITNTNEVYALDASTGRRLWHYERRNAKSTHGNRGVALLGDRVFFASSDAHLIALDRRTGAVVWDVEYAQHEKGYFATLAPLAIDGKVIVGVSGGDCGVRGYIDAYYAESGKHAWRFWTIPGPGEPGSETWGGHPVELSGGATWMTGVYDPQEKVLYWTTGNPGSAFYGGVRPGDNLYANSVLALHPDTGKLKWYFQFTPHDTHDWDAQEFPVLIDTQFQGRQRKLLVQANRNGFFYVLERSDGRMLLAKPFVKKLTWAKGILPNGRPDVIPGTEPTPDGNLVCPGIIGATNWFSPSYDPKTGLFYVMALEQCGIYTSSARPYTKGECYDGTAFDALSSDPGQFFLRALDLQTGTIQWEIPLTSDGSQISAGGIAGHSWPGTLATAGGLVFFGDDAGYLAAADSRTGKTLWHFSTGQSINASPMTYAVAGKQYVTIAAGTDIFSFALFEPMGPANVSGGARAD